jgi:hypothetical protein
MAIHVADADITLNGYKWTAVPISDDGIKITGEATTDALTITAPNTIAPVQMFIGTPPSQSIVLSIFHYHEGDTEAMSATSEILQVSQPDHGRATISCDSISLHAARRSAIGLAAHLPYAPMMNSPAKPTSRSH